MTRCVVGCINQYSTRRRNLLRLNRATEPVEMHEIIVVVRAINRSLALNYRRIGIKVFRRALIGVVGLRQQQARSVVLISKRIAVFVRRTGHETGVVIVACAGLVMDQWSTGIGPLG